MTTSAKPQLMPSGQVRRRTVRHLVRAAMFAAVRGVAYAAGTTTVTVIIWWISGR